MSVTPHTYGARSRRSTGMYARPRGYKADRGALSYAKIERIAARVRRVLAPDIPLNDALPGLELFENLEEFGVRTRVSRISLSYGVLDLPAGVEAETRYHGDKNCIVVGLSANTYQHLERGQGRARHTLNHEVGHAVLHAEQLKRISTLPHAAAALDRAQDHRFCEDTEWQADAFAAALEMPARGLLALEGRYGNLSAGLVSSMMQVSVEAAVNRLNTFGTRRVALLNSN